MQTSRLFFLPFALSTALPAQRIQSPDAAWLTFHTAHYRIHFPAQGGFEDFARDVASRIEGVHDLMIPMVGNAHYGPVDVLVMDPVAQANGLTFSYLDRPHIILWRTPPESDWEIAHGHSWVEELLPHEMVHLHHLTTPDRRPGVFQRLQLLLPQSSVMRKSPRWVMEGYATLLEGRITGMGRPHGAYRAEILRIMAREGRLPLYKQLDRGYGRYLVSSAFLAWLEGHAPTKERTFPQLWQRLSSLRYSTFEKGFQATFGEGPEMAYRRFCAELAHSALEMERRIQSAGLREGELWGFVPHPVQDLSLSPDGRFLLADVQDSRKGGLSVWALGAPFEDEKLKAKNLKRDPDLPAEAEDALRVRKVGLRLTTSDHQMPERPQWEENRISYRLRKPDEEGVLHLQKKHLPFGEAIPAASAVEILHPAWKGQRWEIEVEGKRLALPFEPMGPLSWDKPRQRLYASKEVQGLIGIARFHFDPAALQPFAEETLLTRTLSASLYPAPTPDGKSLYFVVWKQDGAEIRRLDLDHAFEPLQAWTEDPSPFCPGATRPPADEPSLLPPPSTPGPAQPYRVAESHRAYLRFGGVSDPSGDAYYLGVAGNDILPRLDWDVLSAFPTAHGNTEGPRGVMAGFVWRGWAWSPRFTLFSEYTRPSAQRLVPVEGWDQDKRGFELGLDRTWHNLGEGLRIQGAMAGERIETIGTDRSVSRGLAWGKLQQQFSAERNRWTIQGGYGVEASRGRTESQDWTLERAKLSFGGGYGWASLNFEGEAGRLNGSPTLQDRFQLGSQDHGLRPASLVSQRIFQPALPAFLQTGDRFARWRAETPFGLYMEGLSVWDAQNPRPSYLRVAGLEIQSDPRTLPPWMSDIQRRVLGSFEFRIGLHQALDGPTRNRSVFTVALLARY